MLNTRIACEVDISHVQRYKQAVIPESVYKQIGGIIKSRRKTLGHKQEYLAIKLGISRGALANIETGRQRLLVHQLYKFAAVLELSPADLLPPLSTDHFTTGSGNLPLPAGLKPEQKNQVVRLFLQVDPNHKPAKERTHAKTRKW